MQKVYPVRVIAILASHRATEDLARVGGHSFQLVVEDEDQPMNVGEKVAPRHFGIFLRGSLILLVHFAINLLKTANTIRDHQDQARLAPINTS
jgi:hypothetical protein